MTQLDILCHQVIIPKPGVGYIWSYLYTLPPLQAQGSRERREINIQESEVVMSPGTYQE